MRSLSPVVAADLSRAATPQPPTPVLKQKLGGADLLASPESAALAGAAARPHRRHRSRRAAQQQVPTPLAVAGGVLLGALTYLWKARSVYYEVQPGDAVCSIGACALQQRSDQDSSAAAPTRRRPRPAVPDIIFPGDRWVAGCWVGAWWVAQARWGWAAAGGGAAAAACGVRGQGQRGRRQGRAGGRSSPPFARRAASPQHPRVLQAAHQVDGGRGRLSPAAKTWLAWSPLASRPPPAPGSCPPAGTPCAHSAPLACVSSLIGPGSPAVRLPTSEERARGSEIETLLH
jgi:hypothetical protein